MVIGIGNVVTTSFYLVGLVRPQNITTTDGNNITTAADTIAQILHNIRSQILHDIRLHCGIQITRRLSYYLRPLLIARWR